MSLTLTGYDAPTIAELVETMSENARTEYGPLIDTSADSALGHFIGVSALEIIKAYEDLIEFYSNLNANTSEGRMLENLALLGGLVRQDKAHSTGIVEISGPSGTFIPAGTVLHVAGDSDRRFVVRADNIIGPGGLIRALVISEVTGAIAAPIGTLTEFENPITGVTVINQSDITVGTDEIESDPRFRARRNNTLSVGGNGTPAAIRAALEQINGVTAAIVISNPTHSYMPRGDGIYDRPPHSIECVIEGGDEVVIIETIALTKSATSDAFGLLMAFYQDLIGNSHQIRFSRPEIIELIVNVNYIRYSEELFPEDGEGRMAEELIEFADIEYLLGKDILRDRLYEPIFQVRGISNVEITVGTVDGEPLSEANIPIQDYQKVHLSTANITITRTF